MKYWPIWGEPASHQATCGLSRLVGESSSQRLPALVTAVSRLVFTFPKANNLLTACLSPNCECRQEPKARAWLLSRIGNSKLSLLGSSDCRSTEEWFFMYTLRMHPLGRTRLRHQSPALSSHEPNWRRLQRLRKGENVPAPLTLQVSHDAPAISDQENSDG